MGYHTLFHLGVPLKSDTPPDVIGILRYMASVHKENYHINLNNHVDHPLFSFKTRWTHMLQRSSPDWWVYAFAVKPDLNIVIKDIPNPEQRYIGLSFNAVFKNYDNEVLLFLDWITPYLASGYVQPSHDENVGFFRREDERYPTLIQLKETIDRENYFEITDIQDGINHQLSLKDFAKETGVKLPN